MFRSQNELPQNVRFGQLFQTVERSNFVSDWFCSKWRHISSFFDFVWSISGPFTWDALLHSTAQRKRTECRCFEKHFQKLKLKLKKHLWLKTLKEKVKRITIVKGVCTAYEKSTTAQTNSTNVLHMKRQTWQQHTYRFSMDLLFPWKMIKYSFSSHYTKILPESKAKKQTNKQK